MKGSLDLDNYKPVQGTICKWTNPMLWATALEKVLDIYVFIYFLFIFISWRLITLQYCSGFCHTLPWISHGFTSIPHPDPPSHLPLYTIPLHLPSAPGPSTCLIHPAWAGDLFHPRCCSLETSHPPLLPQSPKFWCRYSFTIIVF